MFYYILIKRTTWLLNSIHEIPREKVPYRVDDSFHLYTSEKRSREEKKLNLSRIFNVRLIIFLSFKDNTFCGCSKELPQPDNTMRTYNIRFVWSPKSSRYYMYFEYSFLPK